MKNEERKFTSMAEQRRYEQLKNKNDKTKVYCSWSKERVSKFHNFALSHNIEFVIQSDELHCKSKEPISDEIWRDLLSKWDMKDEES